MCISLFGTVSHLQVRNTFSLKDLRRVDMVDTVSLEAAVRLLECVQGFESFTDKVLKNLIEELKVRRRMNSVSFILSLPSLYI